MLPVPLSKVDPIIMLKTSVRDSRTVYTVSTHINEILVNVTKSMSSNLPNESNV